MTTSRVFPYTSFVLYRFLRALQQNRAQLRLLYLLSSIHLIEEICREKGLNHKRYDTVVFWETYKLKLICILIDCVFALKPRDDDHLLIKRDLVFTSYTVANLGIS